MKRELGLVLMIAGFSAFAYEGIVHGDAERPAAREAIRWPPERRAPLWGLLALAGGYFLASRKEKDPPSLERLAYYRLYAVSRKRTER